MKETVAKSSFDGKPYAGNPYVWSDEGEVAAAETPRRGSLLCKMNTKLVKMSRGGGVIPIFGVC